MADLLVIGSQAILGTYPDWDLPPAAVVSVAADIAADRELAPADLAVDETALADAIDGALGGGSQFHRTFGYYAQGIEVLTATLTPGWRDRLVALPCDAPHGSVVGWCLAAPDLWVAKAAAGRAKDLVFCGAVARAGLVDRQSCAALVERLTGVERLRADTVMARSW